MHSETIDQIASALAAAQASLGAGAFDVARRLLAAAEAGPLDELRRARVDLLQAEVAFAQGRGGDAERLPFEDARFDVVLGNPPYSGHSVNKGEWIELDELLEEFAGEYKPEWVDLALDMARLIGMTEEGSPDRDVYVCGPPAMTEATRASGFASCPAFSCTVKIAVSRPVRAGSASSYPPFGPALLRTSPADFSAFSITA